MGSDCPILQFPVSQSPTGYSYQQSTRMFPTRADGYGRPPSPQVDRSEIRPHLCTRRAGARVRTCGEGTRDAVVELGGQGPLASSPRLVVSNSPSCPKVLSPQHLRVASSCIEKQSRITDWFSNDGWAEPCTQKRVAR